MKRKIFYTSTLTFLLLSPITFASTDQILQCVKKGEKALNQVRTESLSVGVHAGRASPIPCKTRSDDKSVVGKGANANEVVIGNPTCRIIQSHHLERSKITGCSVINKKPVLSLHTHGRGCLWENSATATLSINYMRVPTSKEKENILKECLSKHQK